MHRERRSAKRRPERRRQNEDFECRQNAPDHRANERAARRAIRKEQRTAVRRDVHFRMDRAENRCDRGEPEHDPKLAGRLGKRHRGRTLEWGRPQSNRHSPDRPPDCWARGGVQCGGDRKSPTAPAPRASRTAPPLPAAPTRRALRRFSCRAVPCPPASAWRRRAAVRGDRSGPRFPPWPPRC